MNQFKKQMVGGFALLTAALFGIGCASQMKTDASTDATQVKTSNEVEAAAQLNRSVISTINFSKGHQGLSAKASEGIQSAIAEARKLGEIKSIDVVAWSDLEYPKQGHELPKREVALAEDRAKGIEKAIDQAVPSSTVKKYNMAEEPNAFQKWIETRDAHMKNKLVETGVINASGEALPGQRRASSALVFIEIK